MSSATRWPASSLGCVLSGLAFHIVMLAGLFVLWVTAGLPYGTYRLGAAERGWSQFAAVSSTQQALRNEHSPAALRLDTLARQLGVFLATSDADIRERRRATTPQLDLVGQFVTSIREQPGDGQVTVPPGLAQLLGMSASLLGQFEDTLLAEGPVQWRSNRGSEDAVSLLGFRRLHELLLMRSVLADQRGDRGARERSMEAAWRFEDSLLERPVLIDLLFVYTAARSRNACLRRFAAPPPSWSLRIRPLGRLPDLAGLFRADALGYCRNARRLMGFADANELIGDELRPVGPGRWLIRVGTAPLLRVSVARYAEVLRQETETLMGLDPCEVDADTFTRRVEEGQPYWQFMARSTAPATLRTWWSARDTALDDELTLAVLAQRGTSPRWDGRRRSAVCPGLEWQRGAGPRGGTTVRGEGSYRVSLGASPPGLSYSITAP